MAVTFKYGCDKRVPDENTPMEKYYGPIELGLVFGSALIFMIYELISVRRSLRASVSDKRERIEAPKSSDATP